MRKATKLLGVGAIVVVLLAMPATAFAGDRDVERTGS